MNITDLSASQLRRAASIQERIEKLHKKLTDILGTATPAAAAPDGRRRKRTLSAATRKKMAAAHKARWAKIKATKPAEKPKRKKFTMSASAKAAKKQ